MLFEVQIVDMLHNHMFDMNELDISDGVHSITVSLDTELNYLVDIFDILVVRKAWGHPKRFHVDLVNILLFEIFYIDIFLNFYIDIEVPTANPQNCIEAPVPYQERHLHSYQWWEKDVFSLVFSSCFKTATIVFED